MNTLGFIPRLAAATLALAALAASAAPVVVADWRFSEAANTALKGTANTGAGVGGAGSTFDSNIAGVTTSGTGDVVVRNNGSGGSGTRTAYADFGPVATGTITSGIVSLYTTISAWNLPGAGPSLTLALIEGNSFSTAQFSLTALSSGLALSGAVDPTGDGANLAGTAAFGSSGNGLTVRLSVDLGLLSYSLAYDLGLGYTTVGSGAVDSLTQGVNSLRFGVNGNFATTAQSGLSIDRLWVVQNDVPQNGGGTLPAPATATLVLLAGLCLAVQQRHRKRRTDAA